MVKALQSTIIYKGSSAMENALLSSVQGSGIVVFGVKEAQRLTGFGSTSINNLLVSLRKKGQVVRLRRNCYSLEKTVFENGFAVATTAFAPSYVSFWTALSFYGFTEQEVRVIQIACPKQFKKIALEQLIIQPITIKPKNFFGYVRENGFNIALKEKALIDSASNLKNAGGLQEFAKCLGNAWSEINKELFVSFLLKTSNKTLNSRVGFLIEELSLPLRKELVKKIQTKRSSGFIKLNPGKTKTSNYNKKWGIILNDSIKKEEIL